MTPQEIDALLADRQTDALVAEHVMGWRWHAFPPGHGEPYLLVRRIYPHTFMKVGSVWASSDVPLADGWDFDLPKYASNDGIALTVMEHICATRECDCDITRYATGGVACWFIKEIPHSTGMTEFVDWALADTLALAVCRAALKVVAGGH